MNTVYYTFTTWNEREQAAGFGSGLEGTRQTSLVREQPHKARPHGGNNVIDLTAWPTASQDESWDEPDWEYGEPDWTDEEPDQAAPASRMRRSRRAVFTAELISTLCVAAVSAAIIIRVLTF